MKNTFKIGDIVEGTTSKTIFEVIELNGNDLITIKAIKPNKERHRMGEIVMRQNYTNYRLIKILEIYEIF